MTLDVAALFGEAPQQEPQEAPQQAPAAEEQLELDLGGSEHEAPASEAPTQPQQAPEPKHVPLAALQEERKHRQELQQQYAQQQALNAQMQERFQQMIERMQAAQQPAQQEIPIPPFEEDPAAHIAALTHKYEAELQEHRQFRQQVEQQNTVQAQQHQLFQAVKAHEDQYRQQHADYNEASDFYIQRKLAEYQAFGFDEMSAKQQLSRDIQNISIAALQRGGNPAEALHKASMALGFQAGQQAPQQTVPRQPNGQFAPKPPTTLATASGAPKAPDEGGELSLERVAQMSDAEFDRFWKQLERGSVTMPKV